MCKKAAIIYVLSRKLDSKANTSRRWDSTVSERQSSKEFYVWPLDIVLYETCITAADKSISACSYGSIASKHKNRMVH